MPSFTGQINVFFTLAFLSHRTLVTLDAIFRTIVRVTITRKRLLEWETAAQAEVEERKTPVDVYLGWTPWLSLVDRRRGGPAPPFRFTHCRALLGLVGVGGPPGALAESAATRRKNQSHCQRRGVFARRLPAHLAVLPPVE